MLVTVDPPAGLVADETEYESAAWSDGNNVRFWRGRPESIGGWESLSLTLLGGVCRTVFSWVDIQSLTNIAFGQHNGLSIWQSGSEADITPVAASATGTITITGTPVANETFVVGSQTFTFKASRAGAGEVTISSNNSTQATNIVTAIGLDLATVTAVANTNVVTLTVVATGVAGNATVLTENATGVAVAGFSGGSDAFVDGQIDGTGGVGYGTGAYGVGDYGEPSTTDYFPMTWSFGALQTGRLYANPRYQSIFRWDNVTTTPAKSLTNAPTRVNFILTTSNGQIMAFGCTDTNGNFNPACIRICDVRDDEVWTPTDTNTAQQIYLEGNGRIVGARNVGDYVYVWTDSELHRGTLTDSWAFERIATGCGLAGPNAAHVMGQTAYWASGDYQFFGCPLGGTPSLLLSVDGKPCPIRQDFKDYAAPGQNDKIVCSGASERAEVQWSYADSRDGFENSRIIRLSTLDGAWSRSQLARTALLDAGPQPSPIGVTYAGNQYWHERGAAADGSPLETELVSGGLYLDPGERHMLIREWRPDFKNQTGTVFMTIWARNYPQGEDTEYGPFAAPVGTEKVDMLVPGLLFRFALSTDSSPSEWRLGKLVFDVAPTGRR